jgi:hydroxymethylglutaryl-CoA lyase
MPHWSTPISFSSRTTRSTSSALTSPWYGQPTAHDTYGQAIGNVYASLEVGIFNFDASVAGLGGCPYAKGATGNVATEDVLFLLQGLGIDTGISIDGLVDAAAFISAALGRKPVSRVANALLAKRAAAPVACP